MQYTKLGRSNMSVSKICPGTMHFGPKASEEVSHQILDKAFEMGITSSTPAMPPRSRS